MLRVIQIAVVGLILGVTARAGDPGGRLVYSNVIDPPEYYYPPGADTYLSDDIELIAQAGCLMESYELGVAFGGYPLGGTFDVEVVLYSGYPCDGPSPIAGTQATFHDVPADGNLWFVRAEFDPAVRIPQKFWLRTLFSRDDAGWMLANWAEIGYTDMAFVIEWPSSCGTYWFCCPDPCCGYWTEITGRIVGDLNCDGSVNGSDIDGFITALNGADAYGERYPNCEFDLADINGDGSVNGGDIQAFIDVLKSP